MAQTEKGIIYPYDYNEVADVLADFKALAESIDRILSDYSLNTDSGNKIVLEMNNTTYKIKAVLKDKDDNVIDTSNEIDLPLENMVTNISYNNQILTLTHQDGQTTEVSIADLISDLASKEEVEELQSQISDLETLVETELESNEVEGTEIDVSDSAEYRGKVEVKGNTYQKQLSGKNFFDVSDVIDVTDGITVDEDGWITVSFNNTGSSNKFFNFYTKVSNLLQTSRAYSIITEIKNVSGNGTLYSVTNTTNMSQSSENVSYNFTSLSNNNKYKNIFTTVSDFTNATSMIRTVLRFSAGQNGSITFRLSVLEDTEMSVDSFEYEPYCGGQASPNPDYPQEIKVVTGDNVVKHVGKNFCGLKDQTITKAGVTFIIKDGVITANGTYTANTLTQFENEDNLVLDGNYTVKTFPLSSSASTAPNFNVKNSDGTTLANSVTTSGSIVTFLVEKSSLICGIYAQKGTTFDNFKLKAQIEKGTTTTSYEPYRGEEYKLDLWKENEFNSTNATIYNALLNDAGFFASSDVNKTAIVSCQPNQTYKISKIVGKRLRVAEFSTSPSLGDAYTNRIKNDEVASLVYKTSGTANYLAITYYNTASDTLTEQEILNSIQIQEAIELCKIGDHEDIPFKNVVGDENYNSSLTEGAWYKKEIINKRTLNSSEIEIANNDSYDNITYASFGKDSNDYVYNTFSNKKAFSNVMIYDNSSFSPGWDNSEKIGFLFSNATSKYYWYGVEKGTSLEQIQSKLNGALLYTVRATAKYTQITNPTLISQLEALRKAKWFKGVNHWGTETENLEPNLKGTYKQSNNIKNKERDERLDNLESRLALLE